MAITSDMVKELREKTGAGMMDCKKALEQTAGDMEAAVDELRKRGQAIADKKGARATKEGLIFVKTEGGKGAMLELGCETDFVARNEAFKALGQTLVELVFAGPAATGDQATLAEVTLPQYDGKTVHEVIREAIAKMGENMSVARFVRLDDQFEGAGFIASYIHPPGKLGILVELAVGQAATLQNAAVTELGRDLAMQVAAAAPVSVSRDEVPAELVARERAVYAESDELQNKPANIKDKIIDGKMNKFYKQSCLLEQEFVKNPDQTITQVIDAVAKQAGDTIKVVKFVRFAVGGAAEKSE